MVSRPLLRLPQPAFCCAAPGIDSLAIEACTALQPRPFAAGMIAPATGAAFTNPSTNF
jgi:hypothetical protein